MSKADAKTKSMVLVIVGVLLNIARVFQKTVWADECFTIELVKNDVFGIVKGTMEDFHPPLYYLITKLFCSLFGYSSIVFHVVSLIPVLILSVVGYKWLKEHCDELTGFIFSILILLMPTSYYSIEIRMYSWALLSLTIFTMCMIDSIEFDKIQFIFLASVFALFGAYTHYFALLVAAAIYFYYFIRIIITKPKYIKNILISILICVIAYFPWLIVVIKQMTGGNAYSMGFNGFAYYVKPLAGFVCILFGTLRTIVNLTGYEVVLTIVLAALFLYIVGIYVLRSKENKDKEKKVFMAIMTLFIFCFAVVYIAGCVMDLMSHKFVARYLYPFSGIVFIIFAISIAYFIRKGKKNVHKAVIVVGLLIILFDFGKTIKDERNADVEQDRVLQVINNSVGESDLIITDSRLYNWCVLDYYFDGINYMLCLDTETINKTAEKQQEDIYYIHNYNDGPVADPGEKWEFILKSELGENKMSIYKYKK